MAEVETTPSQGAWATPSLPELVDSLLLTTPLPKRMRAIFYLRTVGGEAAVDALCTALKEKAGTVLFRHEIAYVLGQMQGHHIHSDAALHLRDENDDVIVRHECGEALGAIGDPATLVDLDEFSNCAQPEVAETCQIAAKRVRWHQSHDSASTAEKAGYLTENPYESIDPAPSIKKPSSSEVAGIEKDLLDPSIPLFERYKAMFSLRNNGSKAAVLALCRALSDASPLFRHEVAYVLGQLQHAASIPALKACVCDPAEHEMVRHEAAEALGAIGTSECLEFLQGFATSDKPMLRESCEVAIDAAEYWSNQEAKAM